MNQENGAVRRALIRGDSFKNRRSHALHAVGLAFLLGIGSAGFACAEPAPVGVPDRSFPESVTSTRDGTLYVGSFNLGGVIKVAPDGKTEQLIKPGASD